MIDFLIIGGGIGGISAAARLSSLGTVCVLEAETGLGYHASGRSAAMFEENYGSPSTCALSRASAAYFKTGGYLRKRGLMLVGKDGDETDFDAACKDLVMPPLPLEEAFQKIPILNPATVRMAAFHDDALDLDADRLLQDFARTAKRNGADILTDHRVTAIKRTETGWSVTASQTIFEAKLLFDAAGPWADIIAELAGIAPLGVTPLRRSMARIPAPGGHDITDWPMLMGPREDWYAKPDAGKLLISPSEEDPQSPHDAWADDLVLAEGIAHYQDHVTETVTRLETSWAGLRTFAPDRNLALGPAAQDSGFLWIAAQGGYGFQTAPAASQLIADIVSGAPSRIDAVTQSALDPKRFF
ncbi:Hydrogen cyanide synthase subunit HcnC precursor [Shimia thalassica]|uniref:Hydrogen cyanide synthase subunit HcnC n=1 Tax=Shimia thalassica TaxID=1715693 RepID=A0A0N7M897_9RHOB|nr:FAD-dependent oxidoreductase [Shimia thalassica]CUJ85246.1 Hydrogen cyanide synthase subunit HcnC precursor [Shimia thalassica]